MLVVGARLVARAEVEQVAPADAGLAAGKLQLQPLANVHARPSATRPRVAVAAGAGVVVAL